MRQTDIERLSTLNVSRNRRDFLVMHFLIEDLKKMINQYAKGKIIDIGCGNKPYETLFKNSTSYIGCDVVQSSLHKVDVICEATNIAFSNEQFDTAFSTQVMEHVDDPFKMLKEIFRVLKPHGHLILSVPFVWELHEEPFDFFRFTKYGLQSALKQHGFEVVHIIPNGGKWAAVFQLNLNMLYSTFKRKGIISKILKTVFVSFQFTSIYNRFALYIDKKYHDDLLTLNYVVVARKTV